MGNKAVELTQRGKQSLPGTSEIGKELRCGELI